MAFPTGWGRKQKITIDNTKVSGSSALTNFPALITLDHLDAEVVDAGSNSALNGGGDVRFSSDAAGTTQLACEIVQFVTNATEGSRKCQIWVKIPSVSYNSDTDIYIWYSKTGESQPAVTDTYGRNAVWADYEAVLHLNEASGPWADSTGNGHDATIVTGSISSVSTGHPFGGDWLDFTKTQKLKLASSASMLNNSELTLSYWGDLDSAGTYEGTFGCWDGDFGTHLVHMFASDKIQINGAGAGDVVAVGNTTGLKMMVGTYAYSALNLYKNGANIGSDTTMAVTAGIVSTHDYVIGSYYIGPTTYTTNGRVGEIRARASVLSEDWIATEYNNQSSASTFASAGTPEAAGGGAVAQQIDLQWGVRQLINQSANLQWGVLNTVSQSSSLQWALLNTVSNNTDLRWGLLSLVNQTSDLRWDILAALGLVGQSVDLQWDMLQKAAQSTDLRWRILSLVFKDTDLRWGLINNVSQQADLRYALLANAAQTIDLQWDTLSSLASVSNSVDLRWDILAYVSQSLDAQWSTLELVSTETDLQWQIAVLVSKDADLQWALKQSAGQAVDIRWDVIATTSQSIDLRWSIISDNQFPDITGIITLKSSTAIINIGREHRSLRYSRSI